MLLNSIHPRNYLCVAVNGVDRDSGVERDSILRIPFERIQKDVFDVVRAGNNARQKDAVVISMRLAAKHDNVEVFPAVARGQFFDEASAGHSIADHNQLLPLFHRPVLPSPYNFVIPAYTSNINSFHVTTAIISPT